nr:YraN family protein [bacterium]
MNSVQLGRALEERTCALALERGMEVLARNYHTREGEIDIIARDGDTLVFIEVKARTGSGFGTGAEAVDGRKQRKLILAALSYLQKIDALEAFVRFDVVQWQYRQGGYQPCWIQAAFEAE